MSDLLAIGEIVRIQVHRDQVKVRGVGYRPGALLAVPEAVLGPGGLLGRHDGGWLVDVHHHEHPRRQGNAGRALSVGFTSHYREMTARFGATAAEGVGGENLIVAAEHRVDPDDVAGGLVVRTADGDIGLAGFQVAAPCVEFTSYLMGRADLAPRDEITAEMAFLDGGMRGFVAATEGLAGLAMVRLGDLVYRRA